MRIILASNSPRRRELLEGIGLDFEIVSSNIEEISEETEPSLLVMNLSKQKALSVAESLKDDALIIAADTAVEINGNILGKPRDKFEAYKMLKRLSGKRHSVYTGISLVSSSDLRLISDYEVTYVYIKKLNDDIIWRYINTGECFDKAGSYAIQGYGSLIVSKINGDYFNVVGLPLSKLSDMMSKNFGIELL
ncbi:septum formation protein Maf [Aceticella autotrophica]|uniref:dTTP/UTP pyrophosphatase n=1 Tax=Aceticella autotrophica TaxID=2755338 RepID=A0A975GBM6_9THEO|nr:Maf family protein [Aceticella autotrophica]QSZ28316.1 septum formation protein Maf [Aceticella autotrophica]